MKYICVIYINSFRRRHMPKCHAKCKTHLLLWRTVSEVDQKCKSHPNRFCYINKGVVLPDHQAKITDFVKKTYQALCGVKLGDQDKPFAPLICCKTCVENLWDWRKKERKSMPFGVPMLWREGKDHINDCYFCMANLTGINHKNKHHVQ